MVVVYNATTSDIVIPVYWYLVLTVTIVPIVGGVG